MKNDNISVRMCIGCGKRAHKSEFIKVVRNRESGQIKVLSPCKHSEGRSAYLCKSYECLKKAMKARRLERAFSRKIETEIYSQLEGMVCCSE